MPAATTVTRFAPSPTGLLHLGHAHAALFAAACAGPGGTCLLRLEDIDPVRCRPDYALAIQHDLAWLGLSWPQPVRVQSQHLADYRAVLDALSARGLLYACFCTRADIAAAAHAPHQGPEGTLYPGTCRHLSPAERRRRIDAGVPYALRLDMERAAAQAGPLSFVDDGVEHRASPEMFGDVVLGRKDVPASYHLCVTHDDAAQGVTLVTRGEDLRPATHLHRLLQALMGWPVPCWRHHALLLGPDGRRHAKRDRSVTLASLREAGRTAAEVRAMAGFAGDMSWAS